MSATEFPASDPNEEATTCDFCDAAWTDECSDCGAQWCDDHAWECECYEDTDEPRTPMPPEPEDT